MGAALGLLLLVASFIVNVPGASANTRTVCSNGDRAYGVVAGDTLSAIGNRYSADWRALASYNHIANPNLIFVGQTVCVPGKNGVSKSVTTSVPVQTPQKVAYVAIQPAPAVTSGETIPAMIRRIFGPYGQAAITVATCESGLNPNAYNPSGATGLFQIMPGTWAGTSEAGQSPYNAAANATAAHEIFVRDGYSWREWVCKP